MCHGAEKHLNAIIEKIGVGKIFKIILKDGLPKIVKYYYIYFYLNICKVIKAVFPASLLQSSVSHDLQKS